MLALRRQPDPEPEPVYRDDASEESRLRGCLVDLGEALALAVILVGSSFVITALHFVAGGNLP